MRVSLTLSEHPERASGSFCLKLGTTRKPSTECAVSWNYIRTTQEPFGIWALHWSPTTEPRRPFLYWKRLLRLRTAVQEQSAFLSELTRTPDVAVKRSTCLPN